MRTVWLLEIESQLPEISMTDILRKSLNDLFGNKVKFQNWHMAIIYGSLALLALYIYIV
jgi:hypothetical protein